MGSNFVIDRVRCEMNVEPSPPGRPFKRLHKFTAPAYARLMYAPTLLDERGLYSAYRRDPPHLSLPRDSDAYWTQLLLSPIFRPRPAPPRSNKSIRRRTCWFRSLTHAFPPTSYAPAISSTAQAISLHKTPSVHCLHARRIPRKSSPLRPISPHYVDHLQPPEKPEKLVTAPCDSTPGNHGA